MAGCKTTTPQLPVVRKLDLEGVKEVKQGELRSKILTGETCWLTGWLPVWFPFADRKYYEPNTWRADLRRIERFYEAQGFYDAKVVSEEVRPTPGNNVELKAVIREGPSTHVQTLEVKGLDPLPVDQREELVKSVPVKIGDVFKESAWEQLKEEAAKHLRERGYAEATASGEAKVDLEARTADLTLDVKPGQRYRFGKLTVTEPPDAEIPPEAIAEQARAAVKEGEWYSDGALERAQSRVARMGVFGAVKVTPGTPDRDRGVVPVVVDVQEAPFHTLRAGAGIGIDPIRQEARALGQYSDRNFFGGLRKFDATLKAGYALILFGTAPQSPFSSGLFYTATANFTQPRFLARDLRLNALLESSSNIEQAYRYLGGRARVGVTWHPVRGFSIRPSYNFEAYRLWGTSSLVAASGHTTAPQLTYGCDTPICNVFLSYLEEVIEYDRRDNPLEPHRGFYLSLSLQQGGGPLGGSFTYLRVLPDARYYQPIGDRFTLAVRARAGTLIPLKGQDSPIVSRFFSGGANSMRGFGTNRLSPMQAVPNTADVVPPGGGLAAPIGSVPGYTYGSIAGTTVPIGGNGMFEASIELRWEIVHNLFLAVFSDAGMVTRDSFGGWPRAPNGPPSKSPYFSNMLYALGFGLRYQTPVGPIRVDFAHRLNVGPPLEVVQPNGASVYYPTQGTCFGIADRGQHIAGAPDGPCAFHISIGEAF